jgi:hypothetical protein
MDWETVEPKPFETTDTVQRFEVAVPRAGEATATIVQQRVERSGMAVTSFDDATLVRYTKNGKMSQAVADAIRKGAEMQAAVNAANEQIARIGAEIAEIGTDQDRIRRNIGSIDRNSELYARYMKTLNDQENRLDRLRVEQEEAEATRAARQRELEEYIRGLNVE